MTRSEIIEDVFAAVVPPKYAPGGEHADVLTGWMTEVSEAYVIRQYLGRRDLQSIEFSESEWLVTNEIDAIEGFQPAHDCDACRAGNDQAAAFLRDNPGRWIVLGNLRYTEVWR